MKNSILGLLLILMFTGPSFTQTGGDALKSASKLLSKYNKDPFSNGELLENAQSLLATAFDDEEVKNNPQSWVTRGDIFKSLSESQTNNQLLNPEYKIGDKMAAYKAADAYMMAMDKAQTADPKTLKKVKKSVISGLKEVEGALNNYGVTLYQENNYVDALKNFEKEIKIFNLLKENGEKSRLDDQELNDEKYYFTGITARLADDYQTAIPYLEKLIENGTDESVIYQFLFESYNGIENEEKAFEVLQAGRTKFPDDSNMLFAEINHYLQKGELEKMIENLEIALAKEPDNISVITTLGQVFDQLSVSSEAEGESEKSKGYYEKAEQYYSNALNQNQENFDLNYSMGALHYNRAATLTDDLNSLADDFTPAGAKKYEAIKNEMASYFDKALPYFLKADSVDGKDRNTLIALKEIYARKDDFTKSNEYKDRLDSMD